MSEQKNSKNQEIGAIWGPKASKSGKSYYTGYVEDEHKQKINFVMFANDKVMKDGTVNLRSPDFRVYLSQDLPPATTTATAASTTKKQTAAKPATKPSSREEAEDDAPPL
jgi:hypothetical protein